MYELLGLDIVYVMTSDANLVVSELIITCNQDDVAYLRHNYCTNMEELIFNEKPHRFHSAGRDFNCFITLAQLQAQTIPYWICGEQGVSWIDFYPHASVHLFIHPSLTLNNITVWQRC